MKRHAPQTRDFMTHLPVELERCETAGQAFASMNQHEIHHIPVMNGSHLKGVISRQDLLQSHVQLGDRFATTPLEQVCPNEGLVVSPIDPIDEAVRAMLDRGVDCAVVVDGGFVVGIFTATDVLRFVSSFFGKA